MSRARKFAVITAAIVIAAGVGAFVVAHLAAGKVHDKVVALGAAAGLQVEIGGVSVSPLGALTLTRVRALRLDDSEAFAVTHAGFEWSLADVARGRRMPAAVTLREPRADVRLEDGRLKELDRWRRAVTQALRRGGTRSSGSGSAGADQALPALRISGGVVKVKLRGRYAELVPGVVAVHQIDVALDASGQGTASADVTAPVTARWVGTAQRGTDGLPVFRLRAEPELAWRAPESVTASTGVTELRIGGVGWSAAGGVWLSDASVLTEGVKVAQIARLSVSVAASPTAAATGIVVNPAPWLAARPKLLAGTPLREALLMRGGRVEIGAANGRRLLAVGGDRIEVEMSELAVVLPGGGGTGKAATVTVSVATAALASHDLSEVDIDIQRGRLDLDARSPLVGRIPLANRIAQSVPRRLAVARRRAASAAARKGANKPGWPNPNPQPRRRGGKRKRARKTHEISKKAPAAVVRARTPAPAQQQTGAAARIARLRLAASRADDRHADVQGAVDRTEKRRQRAVDRLTSARKSRIARAIRVERAAVARWDKHLARYQRAARKAASRRDRAASAYRQALSAPPVAAKRPAAIDERLDEMAEEHEPPRTELDSADSDTDAADADVDADASPEKADADGDDAVTAPAAARKPGPAPPVASAVPTTAPRRRKLTAAELPYTKRFIEPLAALHDAVASKLGRRLSEQAAALAHMPSIRLRDVTFALRAGPNQPFSVQTHFADARLARHRDGPAIAVVVADFSLDGRAAGDLRVVLDRAGDSGAAHVDLTLTGLLGPLLGATEGIGLGDSASVRITGSLDYTATGGLAASGDLRTHGVGIDWWRFAPGPVTDVDVQATWALQADPRAKNLLAGLPTLRVGAIDLTAMARLTHVGAEPLVNLRVAMPRQDAAAAARSIPRSLLPTIGTIEATGSVGWSVDLDLNIAHPWFSELVLNMDDKDCRITSLGSVDLAEIDGRFSRAVNEDGNVLNDVRIGPKSGAWAGLGAMPRWVPYAMTTTEDGSFWAHRGLNEFLLNRAVRLDVHYGRFVYGGSTLTQQLVKNLYMTRSKFLARKLEELLIVWGMERTLKKSRILEVYTNAVEFAPRTYGIVRAAEHYFDKPAQRLTPLEAAFLGSLKPCPRCADYAFRARKYAPWYQKRVLQILTRMLHYKVISQEQYDREMNTVPRFVGWPAEALSKRFAWPIPEVNKPTRFDQGKKGATKD